MGLDLELLFISQKMRVFCRHMGIQVRSG